MLMNQIYFQLKKYMLQNKYLFIADGSKLSFDKKLTKEGFKLTKNKHYCKALLSTLYDVTNKMPIKCCIDKHANERKSVIDNLLSEVPKNITILFDISKIFLKIFVAICRCLPLLAADMRWLLYILLTY